MNQTAQALFEYLRDILYAPDHAHLDVDKLDDDFKTLGKGLEYLSASVSELRKFAQALSKGDLSIENLPTGNELAAPLKALHANLRHLTWQSQQVAKGDYMQRVDFMGEFSDAFNEMTTQLEQRQTQLENAISASNTKTIALEASNNLLTEIAYNIPQLLLVLGEEDGGLLFSNKAARDAIEREPDFLSNLLAAVRGTDEGMENEQMQIELPLGGAVRSYTLMRYRIYWNNLNARAFALTDVSEERLRQRVLEEYAYQDQLTKLFNRFYGMRTLNQWIGDKRTFVLCFADLDNLKYINDNIGHAEGDEYIIRSAHALSGFSDGVVACRIGGDEFLLLIPNMSEDAVAARMEEIRRSIKEHLLKEGKPYYSNISYGAVAFDPKKYPGAAEIMSVADERMYENKRENKRRFQEESSCRSQ